VQLVALGTSKEKTNMIETDAEKLARISELDRQIAIRRTSLETGVPPGLLSQGRTVEEIQQHAADAIAWKAAAPPPPPPATAAVPAYNGVGQISRNTLPYLNPAAQLEAWRQGRLEQIGAPAPEPRRNGEQHRNAAP
jgi:hypothetical protein